MNEGDLQKKEVVLDYGSRGIVCNSRVGMAAGSQSRKLKGYIFNHLEKAERMSRKWDKAINSERLPSVTHFLHKLPPLPSLISSPKRCHFLGI